MNARNCDRSPIASASHRRVLFALPGLHRVHRGAEVAFESIARELALTLGHDVTLIGTGSPHPQDPYRFKGVRCVPRERFEHAPSLPVLRSHYEYEELTFLPGLMGAYSPDDYDVTCTCSYPFSNWALRAMRGRRPRPAHIFITQNADWQAQAGNAEYRFFGCDGLVCTNPVYYERNRARWRSALIPNGVDATIFAPGPRRSRFGMPHDAPVALIVSALIPSKRVLEGIRAVAQLKNLHLLVAGDGDLRAEVDALGGQLLGSRFRRVTVSHAEMPDLYRAADVLLHMSQADPSPLAYIEAIATGLPVVAHDEPVTRWTFEDAAFLVDNSNLSNVVAALDRALRSTSPDQVAARRSLVERRFTWSAIAQSYAEFFEEVLSVRSSPRAR